MTEMETKLLEALKLAKRVIEGTGYPVDSAIDHAIAEAETAPQPSADGWIPWAASPPMPVKPGTLVDVEFRDGERAYSVPAGLPIDDPNSRLALDWTHYDLDEDIVAYRIAKEDQQ